MSVKNWTPGPWSLEKHLASNEWSVNGHMYAGRFIGTARDSAEALSNAHLVAAAPELYDALEGALALLESDGARHHIWRRALAKARGENLTEENS